MPSQSHSTSATGKGPAGKDVSPPTATTRAKDACPAGQRSRSPARNSSHRSWTSRSSRARGAQTRDPRPTRGRGRPTAGCPNWKSQPCRSGRASAAETPTKRKSRERRRDLEAFSERRPQAPRQTRSVLLDLLFLVGSSSPTPRTPALESAPQQARAGDHGDETMGMLSQFITSTQFYLFGRSHFTATGWSTREALRGRRARAAARGQGLRRDGRELGHRPRGRAVFGVARRGGLHGLPVGGARSRARSEMLEELRTSPAGPARSGPWRSSSVTSPSPRASAASRRPSRPRPTASTLSSATRASSSTRRR